jgi:hypothetical protein
MRKSVLILPLFLLVYNLYSQQNSLLKNFKYRISNYREINFNAGAGSQANNTESVSGDGKSSSSSGNAGVSYYQVKSTDGVLLNVSGNAGLNFGSAQSTDPFNHNTSKSFSGSSQFSILNKWFRKNLFAELGTDLSARDNTNKNTSVNPAASQKNKQNDYSVAIDIGIGKGRLENITDMQNALWLYKTLQEEKKLTRSLTNDELDELGHAITSGKNTRVLDFRKRTQFILETTDQFFQQKNVLAANDIRYFTSLNDVLFFAINNQRLSGTEIYVRITPAMDQATSNAINNYSSTKDQNKAKNKSILLSAGISKYKPASLRHQNNYGVSLKLNYISYDETNRFFTSGSITNQFDINTINRQAGAKLFFGHAIYPNTRTIISFDIQSEAGYQDVEQSSGFFGMANLSGALNYFISYRTRFTCAMDTVPTITSF